MKLKLLPILVSLSMIVQTIMAPIAHAQQYGYGYPQQSCPYPVTPAVAVSGDEARISSKVEEINSTKADLRAAKRELRELEKNVDKYETAISDVVQGSIFERLKKHMTEGLDCCEVISQKVRAVGATLDYFKKLQNQDFAVNYPAAFEDGVEIATPVPAALQVARTVVADNKEESKARMPAGEGKDKSKPKKKKPDPVVIADPPIETPVTQTMPAPVPQATLGPAPTTQTIDTTCPVTPCPNQQVKNNGGDICVGHQDICREIDEFQNASCGLAGGPNTSHCDDIGFRSPKFLHVCQSGGQILHDVCEDKRYQKGAVDARAARSCAQALTKYAKAIKAKNKKDREVADLDDQIISLKEELADLRKERRETIAEQKALEAECPTCESHQRVASARGSVSSGPSGWQLGLTAAAIGIGGWAAYKGAQAANNQNIETGYPAAPYLAAGAIYPFVQAGVGALMGGVNGAYGCGATISGGGYPGGPGGVGPYGPYGAGGPYGNGGGQIGFPQGYGYPPGAGGMFNPGIGPWGQPGFGVNGGVNAGIGFGGPGGFNPYANPYANPFGGIGGGINGGLNGGIGAYGNPYGSPFGNPFGGIGGGINGGFPGAYPGMGGYPGLGGIGGGLTGGYPGGLGGLGGGGFNSGALQMQQQQAQQYQQQLQYQIQQQQTNLQKYQTEQVLLQDYSRITNQLRMLESGSGYGGGYGSGFGGGIDVGISAGLGYGNSLGGGSSFPTTTGRGR
jgi:hypothetical protein